MTLAPGLPPLAVLRLLFRHPWLLIVRRWNYKSAIVSAACRGPMFFAANLSAGPDAAASAMVAEALFRFATSGFYGAITQSFRTAVPSRAAVLTALIVMPVLGHGGELLFHWSRGTPYLLTSVGVSVAFTGLTTAFNLFAMRRGALVVGDDSATLIADLRRMPELALAFALSWRSRPST